MVEEEGMEEEENMVEEEEENMVEEEEENMEEENMVEEEEEEEVLTKTEEVVETTEAGEGGMTMRETGLRSDREQRRRFLRRIIPSLETRIKTGIETIMDLLLVLVKRNGQEKNKQTDFLSVFLDALGM